jgi:hypothetical protein
MKMMGGKIVAPPYKKLKEVNKKMKKMSFYRPQTLIFILSVIMGVKCNWSPLLRLKELLQQKMPYLETEEK